LFHGQQVYWTFEPMIMFVTKDSGLTKNINVVIFALTLIKSFKPNF
jgi:hypothetical protein